MKSIINIEENEKLYFLKARIHCFTLLSITFFLLIVCFFICIATLYNNKFPSSLKNSILSKKEQGYIVSILTTVDKYDNIGIIAIQKNRIGDGSIISGVISGLKPGRNHGLLILENMNSFILKEKEMNSSKNIFLSTNFHFNPKKTHKHSCRNSETLDKINNDEKHMGDLGNIIANEEGYAEINLVFSDLEIEKLFGRPIILTKKEDSCDEDRIEEPLENIMAYGILGLVSENEEENAIYEDFEKKKVKNQMLDITKIKNVTYFEKFVDPNIQVDKNEVNESKTFIDPLTPYLLMSINKSEEKIPRKNISIKGDNYLNNLKNQQFKINLFDKKKRLNKSDSKNIEKNKNNLISDLNRASPNYLNINHNLNRIFTANEKKYKEIIKPNQSTFIPTSNETTKYYDDELDSKVGTDIISAQKSLFGKNNLHEKANFTKISDKNIVIENEKIDQDFRKSKIFPEFNPTNKILLEDDNLSEKINFKNDKISNEATKINNTKLKEFISEKSLFDQTNQLYTNLGKANNFSESDNKSLSNINESNNFASVKTKSLYSFKNNLKFPKLKLFKNRKKELDSFEEPMIVKKFNNHENDYVKNKINSLSEQLKPVSHMSANANPIIFTSNRKEKKLGKEIENINYNFKNENFNLFSEKKNIVM